MSNIQPLIKKMNQYKKIEENEWNGIASHFYEKVLKKGELYLRQDVDISEVVAFIYEGCVRHYYIDSAGKDITLDFCLCGEFTGSEKLFCEEAEPSPISIEALEQTKMLIIQKSKLEEILSKNPIFMNLFGKVMNEYNLVVNNRVKSIIGLDSASRYNRFLIDYPGLSEKIPQYMIASFLGITPETLSRIRSK